MEAVKRKDYVFVTYCRTLLELSKKRRKPPAFRRGEDVNRAFGM